MAINRFRDRSGLVTRRRVIAYLQRENERQKESDFPVNPPVPKPIQYQPFYMNGFMGYAPNRSVSSLV
jgi:hypothetical protein